MEVFKVNQTYTTDYLKYDNRNVESRFRFLSARGCTVKYHLVKVIYN